MAFRQEDCGSRTGAPAFIGGGTPGRRIHGLSDRTDSERKIGTGFPRWQAQSMRLAVGVDTADPVFVAVIVHFQVVGHLSAAPAITHHKCVCRMMKLEELHG